MPIRTQANPAARSHAGSQPLLARADSSASTTSTTNQTSPRTATGIPATKADELVSTCSQLTNAPPLQTRGTLLS